MAVKWQVRNLALRFMNFLLHLKKKKGTSGRMKEERSDLRDTDILKSTSPEVIRCPCHSSWQLSLWRHLSFLYREHLVPGSLLSQLGPMKHLASTPPHHPTPWWEPLRFAALSPSSIPGQS